MDKKRALQAIKEDDVAIVAFKEQEHAVFRYVNDTDLTEHYRKRQTLSGLWGRFS